MNVGVGNLLPPLKTYFDNGVQDPQPPRRDQGIGSMRRGMTPDGGRPLL